MDSLNAATAEHTDVSGHGNPDRQPSHKLRILLAHDYLTQRGGAERVALAMINTFRGARFITGMYRPEGTYPEFQQHRIETLWPNRVPAFRRDPRLAVPVLARAVQQFEVGDVDLIVASSSGWCHGIGQAGTPKLVYCHNPARWLHQPHDYAGGGKIRGHALQRALSPLRKWDRRAALSATRYVANSRAVQQRIRSAYGIHADIIHPPAALTPDGLQSPVPGLPPGFLLTISRQRSYKNTSAICAAVESLRDERLIVVGGLPTGITPSSRVTGLQGISDGQLRWLYANCKGVVAVGREDFGLTPVEGYAFGKPSVVLRAGGYLDSSVEGLTSVFVSGQAPQMIVRGLNELSRAAWDSDAIKRHAEKFSMVTFQKALRDAALAAV